ncbi:hypothetical protein BH24BAC1_BH24BAC1_36550 [soil metagenome]
MKDYSACSVNDLVEDPFFQRWVLRPDEETETFWESWLLHHPHWQATVEQAVLLVRILASDDGGPSPQEKGEVWERIQKTNESPAQRGGTRERQVRPLWSQVSRIAAAVVLLVLSSVAGYSLLTQMKETVRTQYSETRTLHLPDGSVVVLNSNSTLRYRPDWAQTGVRELWLDGEAYFKVTHTPDHQRFVVHTDGLQVEVLGTEFNVFNRRDQVKVLLSSGKVRLLGEPQEGPAVESVLAPGELAEFSRQGGPLATKRIQHPEEYVAWKEKVMVFRETPFREIAQKLRDLHGFEVRFAAPELGELTFTGTGDANDIEPLLQKISRAFGLKVITSDKQILITKNHPSE